MLYEIIYYYMNRITFQINLSFNDNFYKINETMYALVGEDED